MTLAPSQDCRGILALDRFGFSRAVTKESVFKPHSYRRSARRASRFLLTAQSEPARPETNPSQRRILPGRFRLSSNVIRPLIHLGPATIPDGRPRHTAKPIYSFESKEGSVTSTKSQPGVVVRAATADDSAV